MASIDTLTLEEVEATMAKLRARKAELKKAGKSVGKKVQTLVRRRERLLANVAELDAQIIALRSEVGPVDAAPRRRGRRPKAQVA